MFATDFLAGLADADLSTYGETRYPEADIGIPSLD